MALPPPPFPVDEIQAGYVRPRDVLTYWGRAGEERWVVVTYLGYIGGVPMFSTENGTRVTEPHGLRHLGGFVYVKKL